MSHFKAIMHQILFPASVRPSLRWSLTQRTPAPLCSEHGTRDVQHRIVDCICMADTARCDQRTVNQLSVCRGVALRSTGVDIGFLFLRLIQFYGDKESVTFGASLSVCKIRIMRQICCFRGVSKS